MLAENWLADNAASTGVDSSQYTIFLVNWYGRSDFKFHSFTRAAAADSDTSAPFGARASPPHQRLGRHPARGQQNPARVVLRPVG